MKQQDIEDLRQLIEFLKQHGVAEFDVDRGDLKIRLKFNPQESGPAESERAGAAAADGAASVAQAAAPAGTDLPAAAPQRQSRLPTG